VSLPKKIDVHLVRSVSDKVLDSGDLVQQAEFAGTLLNILTSNAYKMSHDKYYFDSLLENVLSFCADERADAEIVSDVVLALKEGYGVEMIGHWGNVLNHNPQVVKALGVRSAVFADFVSLFDVEAVSDTEVIRGVPNSSVDLLSSGQIEKDLKDQFERGETPSINIVLEVGRVIRDKAERFEVRPNSVTNNGLKRMVGTIHGGVSVKGALDLSLNAEENDASQNVTDAVIGVLRKVTELAKTSKAQIRIISGGLPSQVVSDLAFELGIAYGVASEEEKEVLKRLVVCRYNANSDLYEDVPLIRGKLVSG
jgi:hypothetical protein